MSRAESVLRHLIGAVCSESLRMYVVEPALADLDHEMAQAPVSDRRLHLLVGYASVLGAVIIALPRDIALHRRPDFSTMLRIAAAVAFPGLTTSFSTDRAPHRDRPCKAASWVRGNGTDAPR